MRIVGYSALESVPTQSAGSVVYRATRDVDGTPVVLKTPRGRPTRVVRDRFSRERDVLLHVAGPGVIACLAIEEHDGAPVLVLGDRGLRSLDHQLRGHPLPVAHALVVARGIADALARVHAKQVVHKDVNPTNVLVSSDGRDVVLIDFGIASRVSRERATGASAEVLEGTLSYLAPEQSGRMNRSVDWRSDLYALGATLYEMITGRPPFSEAEPLAMVHAHIARTPPTPTDLQPRIPAVVSGIVMRLLHKSAEDRYQSADGLSADLSRCIAALETGAPLESFPLGTADVRRALEPSPRLYGRALEMALLERAFDRVKAGAVEIVRVSGEPGVGKTALVLELRERITPLGGALAAGKCDQLDRSAPFSVLAQAFRQRARMVLSQSDAEVQRVTKRVRAMPPEHIALLAASVPELARFVEGDLPTPSALPPSESETRLSVAARRLVRCFTSPDAPLVLFLDDLQWADGATLRLLSMLAGDPEASHVLIIAAHRDHGITKGHPLLVVLADLAARGTQVTHVPLAPLAQSDVVAFLADTLRTSQSEVAPLAEVLYQRTSGNPFFLLQMLEALDEAGAVTFDATARRFVLDPDEVRRITVRADVAELLAQRLLRLDDRAVDAIEGAALIGAQFEAGLLASLTETAVEEITAILEGPVEHGLIDVLDARSPDRSAWRYGFVHDRVQQIAAERMSAERAAALHLRLGRMLLPAARDARDARLFAAVDHLDAGRAQMTDAGERADLVQLNLEAGIRARSAGAYPAALTYFEVGRALASGTAGGGLRGAASSALDTSFALEAAEAAYLATDFEKMEKLSDEVIAGSAHVLDRVRAHEVRVNAWIGKNDLERALAEGIEVLRLLDLDLPLQPHKGHVLAGLARTRFALTGYDADRIATLPPMSRPEALAATRIAMGLCSPAYYARPDLLPLVAFAMIRTTLSDGVSSGSSFAFALWGLVMASLGAIETGYSFGLLALRLKDRTDDVRTGNRGDHLHHAHLVIWKHPYAEARAGLRRTYETGYTSGDLEYSAFSAMMSCTISLYAGFELTAVVDDMRAFRDAIRSLAMGTSLYTHEISMQAALCLRGGLDGGDAPWAMHGPIYDERVLIEVHEKANDATNLFSYRVAKALLCIVFGRPDDAEIALAWNRAHPDLAASTVISQMSIYFDVLASLMRARSLGAVARATLVMRVDRQLGTLRKWADLCGANWRHRLDLALAERAVVAARDQEASTLYERAISGARSQGDMLDEALACERAAALHRAHGRSTAEQAYLSAARGAYERWGADAKVRTLERSFPELLVDRADAPRRTLSGIGRSTGPVSASAIDVSAFVASAQVIGKEMMLSRLVEALVRIALTSAGASRAVLLLERQGSLVAVAECIASPDVVVRTVSIAIEDEGAAPFVAASAARFAQRSRTDVVLDDAQADAGYRRDPYVTSTGVRSLLCVPVEQQGKLSAVLHLEHGAAAGVFTHDRVALLRVLSSQAAIALENARLYEDLRVTADAQARFVPKQFLESLSRPSIVDVRLGDHVRKSMTVLFSDIRGFTPLVEHMRPEEHIGFINEYLRHMEPPILRAGGFVDSYIGDAIMALFDGASGGADEALEGAVGMARGLAALNEERRTAGATPLRVGIGLHTGPLTLGTIGGPERMKCGVIGETVNLASRLEALTKTYDSTLLVSDHLVASLKRNDVPAMRVVDRVRMRGSAIPVTVHEVIDAELPALQALRRAGLQAYDRGLEAYYARRFGDAIEALEAARRAWPDDPAAARYLVRARQLARERVADDWTGVEQA
jgi:predicted ATPase/class 3 adenylate cyclase/tRNA A-37 threonylcarbamoyl transferase component Bud32